VFTAPQRNHSRSENGPISNRDAGEDKEDSNDITDINRDNRRVLRGGSLVSQASVVRSANRSSSVPTSLTTGYGFRLARTFTP
jgi:formylglycine-generating enzyme required for sulfatase activity